MATDLKQIISGVSIMKALSVSEGNLPSGFSTIINAHIVYDGCTLANVFEWSTSNRTIPLQRILRDKCAVEFLNELHKTGLTIAAMDCGKPIRSKAERVAELEARGFSHDVAVYAIDHPDDFAEMVKNLKPPKAK